MGLLTGSVGKGKSTPGGIDPEEPVRRVLVVRPNGRLGNQLLLTPLVREIVETYPDCKIDLFVKGGVSHVIFENYPQVDRIIKLPKEPFKEPMKYLGVWKTLRKYHYDLVFNAISGSSSGRLATARARGTYKCFGDVSEELRAKYPDYEHIAKMPVYNFREFIAPDGVEVPVRPAPTLDLRLSAEELSRGKARLDSIVDPSRKTIAIYTFATGAKCYGPQWWGELYGKMFERYVERYNILEVLPVENVSQIDFAAPSYYSKDIREMAALIAHTEVFLLSDSGIMHLAAAAPAPTLGLFSVTPIARYEPYNPGSRAIDTLTTDIDGIVEILDQTLKGVLT